MSKNVLLISVTALKERSSVHLNFDEKLLFPEIKIVQDIEIVPALGSALMARLQDGITANSLSADESTLLNDYITDTLIHYVLAALPMSTSFQFFTKGVARRNSENTDTPSMADLIDLSNYYRNRAEYYRERLIRYLEVNRSKYPQYEACSDGDINPSNSGYTIPCYLPDDDYDNC